MADRHKALAAAQAASLATAELLRFACEGEDLYGPFGLEDPVLELVKALQLAIAIEDPFLAQHADRAPAREAAARLAAAIARWREDG